MLAEGWLAISHAMQPPATELHTDYISFSRASIKRLQKLIYTGIGFAFALVLGLAIYSVIQRQSAIELARISIAKSLAAFALSEMAMTLN